MDDRPGYGCFLGNLYKLYVFNRLITCRKNGQIVYYKDVTKKGRRFIFAVLPSLIFLVLFLIPFVYFIIIDDIWFMQDYLLLFYIMVYTLFPLLVSISYKFLSFSPISSEEGAAMRAEQEKRNYLGRKGTIIAVILPQALIFLMTFLMSFSGAYVRYSFAVATHDQANWPQASATVRLEPNTSGSDNNVNIIKGYIPLDDNTVEVDVHVTNSPYEPTILFNSDTLNQYKSKYCYRSHNIFSFWYFSYDYEYQVPASLFKPTNTLHVESGYAKGDWTIEITPQ